MPDSSGFDVASFQAEVLVRIVRLQKLATEGERFYRNPPFRKTVKDARAHSGCAVLISKVFITILEAASGLTYLALKRERTNLTRKAQAVVERSEVRISLCPALQGVSDDPAAISRAVTPVLVNMALGGRITLPLSADIFAMIALIIARSGVTSYCAPLT